jgi:hypothetical protein
VHRWIVSQFGAAPKIAAPVRTAPDSTAVPAQAGGVELPGTEALTVTFAVAESAGRLTVSVGTQDGAVLHAYGGDVAYQVGKGRIAVDNRHPAGQYTLEVPANLARLTIVVAGRRVFDSERQRLGVVPDTVSLSAVSP